MIQQISLSSSSRKNTNYQPQFKGGPLDLAVAGLQICEANPMVNVAVLDLSTAIIPRTVVESETNPYAGFEAFRRESSGLIINCMIPGFIVAGIAMAIQRPIMGAKSNMSSCWANEDTIKLITDYWKKETNDKTLLFSGDKAKEKTKVYNTIKNILTDTKGIDGDAEVDFSKFVKDGKFDDSIKELTENIFKADTPKGISWSAIKARRAAKKDSKNVLKKAYGEILQQTHASENIKIKGHVDKNGKVIDEYFSQGLGAVVENSQKILKELVNGKAPDEFVTKAKRLVTAKSLLGLGVIIPLAISAQPINRWITEKMSGAKGAPIYKDFGQTNAREQSKEEKAALTRQKFISVGAMIGVALLSIMKMPSMAMLKSITQFKGIFPSMDQARIISTATFSSRMMASEDKNDLREATVRDISLFASFYFLGDYVAKGIASIIQKVKPDVKLINDLKPGEYKGIFKKIWHWTKNTALKSSDEVYGMTEKATKYAKKMRGLCQLGNIAFSMVSLGIVIPKMYRKKTDKEHEKELKETVVAKNQK